MGVLWGQTNERTSEKKIGNLCKNIHFLFIFITSTKRQKKKNKTKKKKESGEVQGQQSLLSLM